MKKHFNLLFIIFLFPLSICSQNFTIIDTNRQINIKPSFFGINSFQKDGQSSSMYLVGGALYAKIIDKINISTSSIYLVNKNNYMFNIYKDSLNVFPGLGYKNKFYELNISFDINKFIHTDFGFGKNFIGEGYRSLFLSKEHGSYPFLKFSTSFGRVKYYNLYTTFFNYSADNIGKKKHASIHYLKINLFDNINLGLFEAILWQAKSENYTGGYEIAYLNPVIFYRPVEFSQQSNKGNAVLGASLDLNFSNSLLYSQILLDDLNISRQKDRDENYQSGFFQNKYAYQVGLKTKFKNFNILTEYNRVQPYTYGHRTILQNYSHMNQSLSHPLGANFKELVFISDYTLNNWKFTLKLTATKIGLDSINTHYGQNIFLSDYDASRGGQHSYGNFNGQGVMTKFNTSYFEIAYKHNSVDVFASLFYRKKESDLVNQNMIFYSIGLRNFPFSNFKDY